MRVLIAGYGYVGRALGERLAAGGHAVWGVRRSAAEPGPGIELLRADLADPSTLAGRLPPGLDAVVFAASADGGGETAYRAAYLEAQAGLLAALGPQRPARYVFVSSTAVYAQDDGSEVDESSPTRPDSHRGRVMLDAERLALGAPIPASVLRFGGIYGPGRTRFVDSVRSGDATWDPGRPHWTNRIHRDDGAAAIQRVLELGGGAPARLVVVDDEPATRETVITWLAERLGVAMPAPSPGDPGGRAGGAGKRCSNRRLRAAGAALRYPTFREGYAEMIAESRDPLTPP